MSSATTTSQHPQHVLIGTAGHIDHGKTSLVGRLTGINTDRLPEEKARGISIDLGFAHFTHDGIQFGVVDVPGHERFVKNMVAGATGVNVALLVVAADDSVMPQTREHLEIMELLGIPAGVVAITKTDLVDPDFIELVKADIEALVEGTFLAGAPIIPVSSQTGAGLDELKSTLARVAREVVLPESGDLFRMPIDRVFSATGHGTIVTGSVLSGSVKAGDTLELLPEVREVRIRGVQHHGLQADDAAAGQRTAINLAGVKADEIRRGMELATPGFLRPSRRLLVELRNLSSSPVVLRDRLTFHLHLGTEETLARLNLKRATIVPGERGFAELRTKTPVVAVHGQRFILRRISPAVTVAGGRVLDPALPTDKRVKDLAGLGAAWSSSSAADRLSALIAQRDSIDESPLEAAWRVGVKPTDFPNVLSDLRSSGRLVSLGPAARGVLVHVDRLTALSSSVLRTIRKLLAELQPRRAVPRERIVAACRDITSLTLLEAVIDRLLAQGDLVKVGANLGPADIQVKLTKNQQAVRARMVEAITASGLTPPTTKELATTLQQKPDAIEPLLHLSCEDGLLVKVSDELYYSAEAIERARRLCADELSKLGQATMAQLRDAWGVSRKFSVPLCEFFDAHHLTVRQGDLRAAGSKLAEPWS